MIRLIPNQVMHECSFLVCMWSLSLSEIAVPSKAQFAKRGTGQVVTIESRESRLHHPWASYVHVYDTSEGVIRGDPRLKGPEKVQIYF